MKYCGFCQRFNVGQPVYCRYCRHTFGVRICSHCHEVSPPEAQACGHCGSAELSEISSGKTSRWLALLGFLPKVLLFILVIGIIRNIEILLSLFVIFGFFYLGYLCMPSAIRGIIKRILNGLWIAISGKGNRR